jgi:hypothetical protein
MHRSNANLRIHIVRRSVECFCRMHCYLDNIENYVVIQHCELQSILHYFSITQPAMNFTGLIAKSILSSQVHYIPYR